MAISVVPIFFAKKIIFSNSVISPKANSNPIYFLFLLWIKSNGFLLKGKISFSTFPSFKSEFTFFLTVSETHKYHDKSDTYAWALTCLEIYHELDSPNSAKSILTKQQSTQIIRPSKCPPEVWDIIEKGLSKNADDRILFCDLFTQTRKLFELLRQKSFTLLNPGGIGGGEEDLDDVYAN